MRMERDGAGKVDLARSVATVPDLLAAGATDVIATLRAFTGDLDAAPGVMQELVRRFQETI
jgi:hypothetical protein